MERALIVRKVWLDKIFDEGKVWEMRSRPTKIRGTVGFIEAGSGLIVGSAEITNSFKIDNKPFFVIHHKVKDLSLIDKWSYAWVLSNAKRFDKPIPYTHPKGAVIWVKIDLHNQ